MTTTDVLPAYKVAYIDIETTGIAVGPSAVTQIAGIIDVEGVEQTTFNFFARPFLTDVIEEEALQIQGKTVEAVLDYEDPRTVFLQLEAVFDQYVARHNPRDKFHFVGFRANFDNDHLRAFWKKNGSDFFGSWFWVPVHDYSAILGRALAPVRSLMANFKLMTVAEFLGLEIDPKLAHDAAYDVRVTRTLAKLAEGFLLEGKPLEYRCFEGASVPPPKQDPPSVVKVPGYPDNTVL